MNNLLVTILLTIGVISGCSGPAKQRLPEGAATATPTSHSNRQWYCEGNHSRQWHCSDTSQQSAPIYSTTAPDTIATTHSLPAADSSPATELITQQTANTGQQTARVAKAATDNRPRQPTQLDYPDNYFAVQLMAAQNPHSIAQFKQQYPQIGGIELTIEQQGKAMHLLLLDVFASYREAKSALQAFSPALVNTAWIRPVGPIKRQLLNR